MKRNRSNGDVNISLNSCGDLVKLCRTLIGNSDSDCLDTIFYKFSWETYRNFRKLVSKVYERATSFVPVNVFSVFIKIKMLYEAELSHIETDYRGIHVDNVIIRPNKELPFSTCQYDDPATCFISFTNAKTSYNVSLKQDDAMNARLVKLLLKFCIDYLENRLDEAEESIKEIAEIKKKLIDKLNNRITESKKKAEKAKAICELSDDIYQIDKFINDKFGQLSENIGGYQLWSSEGSIWHIKKHIVEQNVKLGSKEVFSYSFTAYSKESDFNFKVTMTQNGKWYYCIGKGEKKLMQCSPLDMVKKCLETFETINSLANPAKEK